MHLADAAEAWLGTVTLRPKTINRYLCSLAQVVSSGLETLEDLTRNRVRRYLRARRATVTPQTCNHDLAAIRAIVCWAEEQDLIPFERFLELTGKGLRCRIASRPPIVVLTREQVAELLAAFADVDRLAELAFGLAVAAGPRLDELRRVHREDMELEREKPFVFLKGTKTPRSAGPAAIAPVIAAWLRTHPALPERGPLFPANASGRGRPSRSDAYLKSWTFQRWAIAARYLAGFHCDWLVTRRTYGTRLAHTHEGGTPALDRVFALSSQEPAA